MEKKFIIINKKLIWRCC